MKHYRIRIGVERVRVELMTEAEYVVARRLRPFTRPQIVTNTASCPVVSGSVLQMATPKGATPSAY